ncbi:MAG: ankyrin repeat domain-containing protein [Gammaproteobacteria bacterium]|nr:ankyrin repeat domain-containing protein [Gammaproteobacteria bacterium]
MFTFDQNKLIEKLNEYLSNKKSLTKLPQGYCHGLSLLWLHHMSLRTESSFYQLVIDIISLPLSQYTPFENRIDEFIARIEWLQNANDYDNQLEQFDVEKLLEVPHKISFSGVFNHRDLNRLLKSILDSEKMICLSGIDHSIGIYCRDEKYYIYDPNYVSGKAKIFSSIKSLTDEIFLTYLSINKKPSPTLSLFFNIATHHVTENSLDEIEIKKQLTDSYAQLNRKDALGNNSLHLASENNDIHAIHMLLKNGVNVNMPNLNQETALFTAVNYSRYDVVNLLLTHGAQVNAINIHHKISLHYAAENNDLEIAETLLQHNSLVDHADKSNKTPLVYAVEQNHILIIKTLIANNANPLHLIDKDNCILSLALSKKRWDAILFLLINIKNINQISNALITEIAAHEKNIRAIYKIKEKFFSPKNQLHLSRMITELCPAPAEEKISVLSSSAMIDIPATTEDVSNNFSNPTSTYSYGFFSLTHSVTKLKENIISATSYLGFKMH